MGNHTHSDDYRLYARPPAGQAQDTVHIVDDGGTVPSVVQRAAGNDDAVDRAAARQPSGRADCASGTSGREDGSARADSSTGVEEAGNSGRADGAQGASAPGGFSASHGLSASDGSRRWLNPYLCAAWALVAMMLATGLFWLMGALEPPRYVSVDPATGQGMPGVIASNLYSMGPFLLLIGLIGALTLLTVQAAGFRRVRGR